MPENGNGNGKMWSNVGKPLIGFLVLVLVSVLGYVGVRADSLAQDATVKAAQLDIRCTALERAFDKYIAEHGLQHQELRADVKELLHRIPKGN
jgi:Tfp pilus assembly protein PilO